MNISLYFSVLGILALCGGSQLAFSRHRIQAIKLTVCVVWCSWVLCVASGILAPFSGVTSAFGFSMDPLSSLMGVLILFISGIVHLFSLRYMKGDRYFEPFFLKLIFLTGSILGFVTADHIFLCAAFWVLNQILLSGLIIHKSDWLQAKEGGWLFLKWALIGSLSLSIGLSILSLDAGSFSIQKICMSVGQMEVGHKFAAFLFILLGSLIQSGLWPFHRWLISSLNSPTPVSAFMHAGLVNGGGLLLARFAPLVLSDSIFLMLLVGFGTISLILGTIWKLIQSNIKKMLACSTMAQMGFMFLQCGLGLFPAAVAHICLHGLFKGFLFLNAGSAIESKTHLEKPLKMGSCLYSLLSSGVGAFAFSWASGISINGLDTQIVLVFFAAIPAFHISLSASHFSTPLNLFSAPMGSLLFGIFYGTSIQFFESILQPMGFWNPQPVGIIHLAAIGIVFLFAIVVNYLPARCHNTPLWKRAYVKMLNASQSDRKTITAIRSEYQF